MKLRFIFGCICLLALTTFAVAWTIFFQPTATAHVSLLAPTPTPTPTPTTFLTTLVQNVVSPLQSIADLLAVLLIVFLGTLIAIHVINLIRVSNLIVQLPQNATGNADLDKVMPGFLQRIRESLKREVDAVRILTRKYKAINPNQQALNKFPTPEAKIDDKLGNLLKSLQDATSGDEKVALQLIGLAFPPRGTQVSMVLHNFNSRDTQLLNVSLEVTDLRDEQEPSLYTIHEPATASQTSSSAGSSNVSASANAPDPGHVATSVPTTDSHQQPSEPGTIETLLQALLSTIKLPGSDKAASDGGKPDLPTLEKRLMLMQPPVARWLAIEVVRRSLIEQVGWWLSSRPGVRSFVVNRFPGIAQKRQRAQTIYKARLHNYIGSFHESAASWSLNNAGYLFFYDQAVENFKWAIWFVGQIDQKGNTGGMHWYLPYENLGDTYNSLAGIKNKEKIKNLAQLIATSDKERSQNQKQLIACYEEVIRYSHQSVAYYTQALSYHLMSISQLSDETKQERNQIKRRIYAERATACLQLAQQIKDQPAIDQPTKDQQLKQYAESIKAAQEDIKEAEVTYEVDNTSPSIDTHLLYNLACCYALLAEQGILLSGYNTLLDQEKAALRFLVYSAARDENHPPVEPDAPNDSLLLEAKIDPQLQSICRDGVDLDNVRRVLLQALANDPRTISPKKEDFDAAVDEVVKTVNWSSKKKENNR